MVLDVYATSDALDVTDDFETMDLSGGKGWKDPAWITQSYMDGLDPLVVDSGYTWQNDPYEGQGYAFLEFKKWIMRSVDLSQATNPVLSFKYDWYSEGPEAYGTVYIYEGSWHNVLFRETATADYVTFTLDLSTYNLTDDFKIAFEFSSLHNKFRSIAIDDIRITNAVVPSEPTEPSAPSITTQPQSQSVTEGDDATFTVTASGNPTPSIAWYRDGAATGASGGSYTITGTALSDDGTSVYAVASNSEGSDTSSVAT